MSAIDAVILNEVKKVKNLVSSGSGAEINEMVAIRSSENLIDYSGAIYLKSGYIEDDVSVYPDASRSIGAALGGTHPIIPRPTCSMFSGTSYWVGSTDSTIITEYDLSWVPTGLTKDIGMKPHGLGSDGTNFWAVSGVTDEFRRFTTSWVYDGLTVSTLSVDGLMRGIAADLNYLYLIGTENNKVYRWTKSGVFVDEFFDVSSKTITPSDILIVNDKFWISGRFPSFRGGIVAEFDGSGNPTSRQFLPIGDTTSTIWNGTTFWSTLYNGTTTEYTGEYVGIPRAQQSGEGFIYMRVK